jgi:drug/metabolite transporter (DMT)-like permease
LINILLTALYIFLTIAGLTLFKLGTNSSHIGILEKGILSVQLSFTSLIGLFCYLISFFIYMFLISKNTFSFFVPVSIGIVYILLLTVSVFILKEKVTLISLVGSLFILIGVILIVIKRK